MFRDQTGQPLYVNGAYMNITAHKQIEEALRKNEERKLHRQTQQPQEVACIG